MAGLRTKLTLFLSATAVIATGILGSLQRPLTHRDHRNQSARAAMSTTTLSNFSSTISQHDLPLIWKVRLVDRISARPLLHLQASLAHHRKNTAKPPVHQTKAAKVHLANSSTSQPPVQSHAVSSVDVNLFWLARVIEAEAGGEPANVKIAVGDVVLNRVSSALYPNSVKGVIFQKYQGIYEFTSVKNGWIYHTPSTASVSAARSVLYQHVNLVPAALVFYAAAKTSLTSWVVQRPVVTILGNLTFAK